MGEYRSAQLEARIEFADQKVYSEQLVSDFRGVEEEIQRFRNKLQIFVQRESGLIEEKKILNGQISDLENLLRRNGRQHEKAIKKIEEDLETQRKEYSAQLEKRNEDYTSLESEMRSAIKEMDEKLESQRAEYSLLIESKNSDISKIRVELNDKDSTLEAQAKEIDKLKSALNNLDLEKKSWEGIRTQLFATLEAYKLKINSMTEENITLKEECSTLKHRLAQSISELEKYKILYQEYTKESKTLKDEYDQMKKAVDDAMYNYEKQLSISENVTKMYRKAVYELDQLKKITNSVEQSDMMTQMTINFSSDQYQRKYELVTNELNHYMNMLTTTVEERDKCAEKASQLKEQQQQLIKTKEKLLSTHENNSNTLESLKKELERLKSSKINDDTTKNQIISTEERIKEQNAVVHQSKMDYEKILNEVASVRKEHAMVASERDVQHVKAQEITKQYEKTLEKLDALQPIIENLTPLKEQFYKKRESAVNKLAEFQSSIITRLTEANQQKSSTPSTSATDQIPSDINVLQLEIEKLNRLIQEEQRHRFKAEVELDFLKTPFPKRNRKLRVFGAPPPNSKSSSSASASARSPAYSTPMKGDSDSDDDYQSMDESDFSTKKRKIEVESDQSPKRFKSSPTKEDALPTSI
eukprot:TRINITY_DN1607_c0_g6_i1.p1 TRINITY_DN1607_c0_g6~~TRINITY_DN1607_c0_g6_i1.p1  ORF type:complete len:642 (-),score=182.21 TRINITY_DN1607_c0_g6_i1:1040-2965(-)